MIDFQEISLKCSGASGNKTIKHSKGFLNFGSHIWHMSNVVFCVLHVALLNNNNLYIKADMKYLLLRTGISRRDNMKHNKCCDKETFHLL